MIQVVISLSPKFILTLLQGVYTAKRIMCVLGTTNPDITYAPTIFPLTCAFLHYLPEEVDVVTIFVFILVLFFFSSFHNYMHLK